MRPIQQLQLNYFKFFTDNEPIKIDEKNLLIYGENGSGKSSIYWGLYTLLEAVFKENTRLNNYFEKGHIDSLLNLYVPKDEDAFVELIVKDKPHYRIAKNDFSIRTANNIAAEATLRASDFLNYRFMFRLVDFRHNEEINLFELFEKDFFPYIKTRKQFELLHIQSKSVDFNEIFSDLKKGPLKTSQFPAPTPTPTPVLTPSDEQNRQQKEFASKFRDYIEEIDKLCRDINIFGNEILQKDLGYEELQIELKCQQNFRIIGGSGTLTGQESDYPEGEPFLRLNVWFNGTVLPKPQSFLNEARLTAIGLAIRLGILAIRKDYADDADFQLLVIDDLLISLDMSNRDKVLDLILKKYTLNYQLIVLTHDRAFYEKSKRLIKTLSSPEDWIYLEMFEDRRSTPSKPFIKKSESFIESAYSFFHQFEYPAAANSLRKACEELLIDLLPLAHRLTDDYKPIIFLDNLLAKGESYYKNLPINYSCLTIMREYIKTLMNPLSHSDLSSPIYREELKQAFKSYEEILNFKNLKQFVYLQKGTKLSFELKDQSDHNLKFEIELKEDLGMNYISENNYKLGFCKFKVNYTEAGDFKEPLFPKHKSIEKFYLDACKQTGNAPLDINKDVIFNSWPNLTQLLQLHGFI